MKNIQNIKNLRRIPVGEYLKLKKESFLLYCYLQQISYFDQILDSDTGHRYIYVDSLNYSEIKRKTGIKEYRTLYKKINSLQSSGFIELKTTKEGKQVYILPCVGDYYTLIDFKIEYMKSIMKMCDENLLRVMLFHKSYSKFLKDRKGICTYKVNREYIAQCIGLKPYPINLQIITDCNNCLAGFKVIKIEKRWEKSEKTGNTVERNYYTFLQ